MVSCARHVRAAEAERAAHSADRTSILRIGRGAQAAPATVILRRLLALMGIAGPGPAPCGPAWSCAEYWGGGAGSSVLRQDESGGRNKSYQESSFYRSIGSHHEHLFRAY